MWYTDTEEQALDYSKPICATTSCGEVYILTPSNESKSYEFRSYDWFNMRTGEYNSCMNYRTVEEAIKMYGNVRNCKLTLDIRGE